MQLPRSSVAFIEYKSLASPKHWSEFGGVLGSPAGGNFVVGARWPSVGLRLSGAYWGTSLYGAQLAVPINVARSENTSHNIAPFVSESHLTSTKTYYTSYGPIDLATPEEWTCVGLAYELNTHGFDLEFGLDVGTGDFSNPQLAFQIGYVHQNK